MFKTNCHLYYQNVHQKRCCHGNKAKEKGYIQGSRKFYLKNSGPSKNYIKLNISQNDLVYVIEKSKGRRSYYRTLLASHKVVYYYRSKHLYFMNTLKVLYQKFD